MTPRISDEANAETPPKRTASIFDKIAATVDEKIQEPFATLGSAVGASPGRTMIASVFVCILCTMGLSNIQTESRSDKLWIPKDTQSQKDQKAYQKYFPREGSVATIIAESKSGNVLEKQALLDLLALHDKIVDISITEDEDGNVFNGETLRDLCVPSYSSAVLPCFTTNILAAWDYQSGSLSVETSVLGKINGKYSVEQLDGQLGRETFADAAETSVSAARAVKLVYYLKSDTEIINNRYESVKNDAWEKEFLALVDAFKSGEVDVFASATRSFSDEFGSVIGGDVVLINLAYIIMVCYLSVNLGALPCRAVCPNIGSRVLLSLSSVLAISLSMASSFGVCAGMGYMWTPVHSVLPFVILGLGVDDSFVISNAFDHTSRAEPIPDRLRHALAHAATSITVTSLTDFVAFAISTTSALPALASFCMYAAVNILFLFILQITFFAAAVCLDEERQQKNHTDCCPCCSASCVTCCTQTSCCSVAAPPQGGELDSTEKAEKGEKSAASTQAVVTYALPDHEQGQLSKFFEHTYAPLLLSKGGKLATIAAFVVLLGVCCGLGVPNLSVEDNTRAFVPDGSYLLEYFAKQDKYFGEAGVPLYIVTTEFDYFTHQKQLTGLKDDVARLSPKYTLDPVKDASSYNNWYDAFVSFCTTMEITGYDTDKDTFYQTLHYFLESPYGGFYNSSIVFSGFQEIAATRVVAELKSVAKYYDGRLQVDADKAVDAMDKVRGVSWNTPAYPWSYAFQTWETFKIIQQELYMNVLLCLLAVLVITTLLIGHPGTSGLVFLCVTMTVADILGCMQFWGIFIDNVSVIQAVIAIGLCVDYAAHVGHGFMLKAGTRDERVTAMLADIGAAVMNGGLSTFLAVMLLAGSKSYVFRVLFQQFFLTVVLGLGHGMILLPVLLSLVGPQCYASVDEAAANKASEKAPQVAVELTSSSTVTKAQPKAEASNV